MDKSGKTISREKFLESLFFAVFIALATGPLAGIAQNYVITTGWIGLVAKVSVIATFGAITAFIIFFRALWWRFKSIDLAQWLALSPLALLAIATFMNVIFGNIAPNDVSDIAIDPSATAERLYKLQESAVNGLAISTLAYSGLLTLAALFLPDRK